MSLNLHARREGRVSQPPVLFPVQSRSGGPGALLLQHRKHRHTHTIPLDKKEGSREFKLPLLLLIFFFFCFLLLLLLFRVYPLSTFLFPSGRHSDQPRYSVPAGMHAWSRASLYLHSLMDYYDLSFFSVLFCSVKKKKIFGGLAKIQPWKSNLFLWLDNFN